MARLTLQPSRSIIPNMIGSLGMPEIIFILVVALLIFGPKRLPQVGRTLGRGLREFRQATNELKRTVETEISTADVEPVSTTPTPIEAAAPVVEESEADEAKADEAKAQEAPVEPVAAGDAVVADSKAEDGSEAEAEEPAESVESDDTDTATVPRAD